MDGHKLHNTKKDLQRMKDFTNRMCEERGLSVAQKGRDFHGNELEQGTVSAWSKDKYPLMQNEAKDSFVADCGMACLDALEVSCSREDFIRQMAEKGWNVIWKDSRKHITFQNAEGKKVRDSNLSRTFHLDISKEALTNEFERQAAARDAAARYERELADRREQELTELERYYREVQDAAGGAIRDDSYTESYHPGEGGDNPPAGIGYGEDGTELFLADIQTQVRDSESQRQDREAERGRLSAERERKAKEAKRGIAKERTESQRERRERGRPR